MDIVKIESSKIELLINVVEQLFFNIEYDKQMKIYFEYQELFDLFDIKPERTLNYVCKNKQILQ